jgi:hypothetical protein
MLMYFTHLWEIHQDFGHLISSFTLEVLAQLQELSMVSLTAAHIYDNVTVGELGQGLRNDSLAASESTGNTHSTTLDTGEKRVEHTLADNQGAIGGQFLGGRTRNSYGPSVHHAVLGLGAVEVELQDLLVYSVAALLGDAGNGTLGAGREQDLVLAEETVLKDSTKDIATSDVVADLELARCEVPLLLAVEGGEIDTTGNVNAVRVVGDTLERALNTVVDGLHETGAKLDGQGLSGPEYRVADSHTSCNALVQASTVLANSVPVSS